MLKLKNAALNSELALLLGLQTFAPWFVPTSVFLKSDDPTRGARAEVSFSGAWDST